MGSGLPLAVEDVMVGVPPARHLVHKRVERASTGAPITIDVRTEVLVSVVLTAAPLLGARRHSRRWTSSLASAVTSTTAAWTGRVPLG
jgi:hypothetical protein